MSDGLKNSRRGTPGSIRNHGHPPVRLNHIWQRASLAIEDGMVCSRVGCDARWLPHQRRKDISPAYCTITTS